LNFHPKFLITFNHNILIYSSRRDYSSQIHALVVVVALARAVVLVSAKAVPVVVALARAVPVVVALASAVLLATTTTSPC
jgi:hypothetical protein